MEGGIGFVLTVVRRVVVVVSGVLGVVVVSGVLVVVDVLAVVSRVVVPVVVVVTVVEVSGAGNTLTMAMHAASNLASNTCRLTKFTPIFTVVKLVVLNSYRVMPQLSVDPSSTSNEVRVASPFLSRVTLTFLQRATGGW